VAPCFPFRTLDLPIRSRIFFFEALERPVGRCVLSNEVAGWSGKERKNMNSNNGSIRARWLWRLAVLGTAAFGALAVATWAPAGQSTQGAAGGQMAQPVVVAAQAGPRIEITKHKFSRPTLTVPAGTTNILQSADPQNPAFVFAASSRNLQVDGTLRGGGLILVRNATALRTRSCRCNEAVKNHFEEVLRGVYPDSENDN